MSNRVILLIESLESEAIPIETTFDNETIQTMAEQLMDEYTLNDLDYNQDTIIRGLIDNGIITRIPGPEIMKITID